MPHEVLEIKAGSEAYKAHIIAFDVAAIEIQVIETHFALLKALMAE